MITTNGKYKVPLMGLLPLRVLSYLWPMSLIQLVHGQVYVLAHQMDMHCYQTCIAHLAFSIKLPFPVPYASGIIKLMEDDVGTTFLDCTGPSLSLTPYCLYAVSGRLKNVKNVLLLRIKKYHTMKNLTEVI